jgi:transcription initiation factor TFIID subunit 5
MTGHKGVIFCLAFENTGRYLASAGADKKILFWDISFGYLIAELSGHHDIIYSLSFSRGLEGAILASGGIDDCINLWDVQGLIDDIDSEELNITHTPFVK